MSFTSYSTIDFNKRKQSEQWSRVAQFINLDAFLTFVKNPPDTELQQIGSSAMRGIFAIAPEVSAQLGNGPRTPGSFQIYVDANQQNAFVSLAKLADNKVDVWSCARSAQPDNGNQPALDGAACLKKLAALALGARSDVSLKYEAQADKSFMWKAPSVHPMQVLENAYQRFVQDAARKPGVDPKDAQSEALAEYFMQAQDQPELFSYRPTDPAAGTPLSSVSMNHLISTFYLFRLLVKYTVQSTQAISEETRVALSGDLTKLLHNGDRAKMAWLSAWLTKKMADLGEKIEKLNTGGKRRAIFFVKGGRALNYYLGTPEKGENDWDTQVVIDPHLPPEEWYQCFNQVHDVLLVALEKYQNEFTKLVAENTATFSAYLQSKSGPEPADDEETDDYELGDIQSQAEHANCKAELIDIGIPRRDSPSALEEWTRLSAPGGLMKKDGVIFPHREYYLNEYLMMIRDAFLPGADVRKAPKRITRFGLILASDDHEGPSPVDIKRLESLPKISAAIAQIARKEGKAAYRVIFSQFVEAYNLLQDKQLATLFDAKAAEMLANPPALPAALAAVLDQNQQPIARDVFVAHSLSQFMGEHWKSRSEFFDQHRAFFLNFLSGLYRNTGEKLQPLAAQFAVAGSYAVRLHADHLRITPKGVEPIRRILVKLQCPHDRNEVEVLNAVRDIVKKAAADSGKLTVSDEDIPNTKHKSLRLFWSEPVQIGSFSYSPLVMKIRAAAQTGTQLPVLASIAGLPVLDLRYVVADYLKKTSKVDESGSRAVLASATAAVTEMLSRFDFESDADDDEETGTGAHA